MSTVTSCRTLPLLLRVERFLKEKKPEFRPYPYPNGFCLFAPFQESNSRLVRWWRREFTTTGFIGYLRINGFGMRLANDGEKVEVSPTKKWVLETSGSSYLDQMTELGASLAKEFNVDVHVKLMHDQIGEAWDWPVYGSNI